MRSRGLYKDVFALVVIALAISFGASAALAQSSSFTYQGRLTDGGTAANGNYDLQFALWDSLTNGAQVGSPQTINTVAVSNGVFTVSLDFGANAFTGASRFLEISARPSTGGSFTLLSPRQQITSTPYAVRSLNAASADSVPAGGVSAGSGNYIQNATSPQASSNFSISGNGTAGGTLAGNVVNATTQYNINGTKILSNSGNGNLFAGTGAGAANTTGARNTFLGSSAGQAQTAATDNTFVGFEAGKATTGVFSGANTFVGSRAGDANTTGFRNTFVGSNAGLTGTTAQDNTFIGSEAGKATTSSLNTFVGSDAGSSNTTGSANSFFGYAAGALNTIAIGNAFFGYAAGNHNTEGSSNAFFGYGSGIANETGSNNSFFGRTAGGSNLTGSNNTIIGYESNVGSGSLSNASAIGAHARVDASNALVLGGISGINGGTDTNVGIGTTTPAARLHVVGTTGLVGNVGIGTTSPDRTLTVAGRARISSIPQEPSGASLCFDFNGNLLQCGASSLRFKTNVQPFLGGLDIVRRLRPINFNWKESGLPDIGLGAEDVAKVAPSFTFTDDKGEVTGVKYERLDMLLINAIKEQQAQIATLQQVNSALNARLRVVEKSLKKKAGSTRRRQVP